MARRHLGTVAILALASASLGPAFSRSRAKPLYAGWPTMNINVVEFGADPTGKNDSTAAIQAAVDAAANVSAAPNRPSVIGSGGVLVDFVGGTFAVSAPITLYGYRYNGLVLRGGTLVVMPSFAASGFALDLRQISQVNIEDLTIDMQHSGGCARFDDTLQSTVTNLFCLHYSSWGVLGDDQVMRQIAGDLGLALTVLASRDSMVWATSSPSPTRFSRNSCGVNRAIMSPHCRTAPRSRCARSSVTSIPIADAHFATPFQMRFPDSNILNVVIRCTRVGVVDLSGSNSWQNLHIYATCNSASSVTAADSDLSYSCCRPPLPMSPEDPSGSNVAVGFYAGGSQTRIGASYFDDSPVCGEGHRGAASAAAERMRLLYSPQLIVPAHMWLLTLTDSLFYGLSDLVVAPLSPNVTPVGLMASRNIFSYTDYGQVGLQGACTGADERYRGDPVAVPAAPRLRRH